MKPTIKPRYKFYFQNSCTNVAVTTFTPSDNGGKQAFTVTGYDISQYLDQGDDLAFTYDGNYYVYTVVDITGNQLTMSFDYNASITNVNTSLQFSIKTEANPLGFDNGKFEWNKDKDNYFYRMKYSGKVKFVNADYKYLKAALFEGCCRVSFKIYKLCENVYSLHYRSNITKFEGTWNESHCTFESEIIPVDKYHCITSVGDNIVDIYQCAQFDTLYLQDDAKIGAAQSPFFEYAVRPNAPVSPGSTWVNGPGATWSQVNGYGGYANDPFTNNPWTLYLREVKVVTYLGGINFVTPAISGYSISNEQRVDGMVIVRYTKSVLPGDASEIITQIHGTGGDCEFTAANAMVIYDPINDNCIYVTNPNNSTFSAYNSVRMDDSIILMASVCNNIQSVNSDLFEINPIGDTPGYSAGVNYVTGATNYLANLTLSQMADVIINGSTNSANCPYSFNKAMKDLNTVFNSYWFIDAQNRLRIEHDSWFINQNIANVAAYEYNKAFKVYTYIKEDVPNREKFTFKYALNPDFVGADIIYNDVCSDKPVSLTRATDLTTDIHYLRNSPPETFSTEGIVMFCTDGANVIYEIGRLSGVSIQNNHLSWANLQENYHTYGRVLEDGLMNYMQKTFDSFKKRKKQTNQKYLGCCLDIGETLGTIITEVGTGDAVKITFDINSSRYTFELNI